MISTLFGICKFHLQENRSEGEIQHVTNWNDYHSLLSRLCHICSLIVAPDYLYKLVES